MILKKLYTGRFIIDFVDHPSSGASIRIGQKHGVLVPVKLSMDQPKFVLISEFIFGAHPEPSYIKSN